MDPAVGNTKMLDAEIGECDPQQLYRLD